MWNQKICFGNATLKCVSEACFLWLIFTCSPQQKPRSEEQNVISVWTSFHKYYSPNVFLLWFVRILHLGLLVMSDWLLNKLFVLQNNYFRSWSLFSHFGSSNYFSYLTKRNFPSKHRIVICVFLFFHLFLFFWL